jgi:hypothetical protein
MGPADEQAPPSSRAVERGPLFARRGPGVLLALLLAVALGGLWSSITYAPGIDFYQFWAVGQAVEEKLVDDVYAPAARPRLGQTFFARAAQSPSQRQRAAADFRKQEVQAASTPFLYTVFWTLQSGDYDTDLLRYRVLGLACVLLSIAALGRLLGYALSEILLVLVYACAGLPALQNDLAEGNVNALQLALLALPILLLGGVHRAWRTVLAGVVLGLGLAFKPNVVLAAALLGGSWALARRWRELCAGALGLVLGLAFALVSASLFFGSAGCWGAWLVLARTLDQQLDVGVHWGNFALARLVRDATGFDAAWVLLLAALGLVATCLVRGRRSVQACTSTARLDALMIAIGPVISLFAGRLAWPHYLLLALPLLLLVLQPRPGGTEASARARVLLTLLLGAGLSSPMLLAVFGVENPYPLALAQASAAVLLFALGLGEVRSSVLEAR